MSPVLETERLILRPPGPGEVAPFIAFMGSARAHFVGGPLDADKAWRIAAVLIGHWQIRGYGPFAMICRKRGHAIGAAGIWNPSGWPAPELSWSLWDSAFEGQGYAAEGARAAHAHAFAMLDLPEIVSLVDEDNAASIRVAERLGAIHDPCGPGAEPGTRVYRHSAPAEAAA